MNLDVAAGTYLLSRSVLVAGFLAVMSVTTAPAATQMVIRECQSEGRLTDTILPLIGINNLVAGDITTRITLKLTPDDTIETAMEALKKHPSNTWLVVVDKDDPKKLLGMVRHNDVLSTHLYQGTESNSR